MKKMFAYALLLPLIVALALPAQTHFTPHSKALETFKSDESELRAYVRLRKLFPTMSFFYLGRAKFQTNGLHGLIDTNGAIIVSPTYDYIEWGFSTPRITVQTNDNKKRFYGVIDLDGNVVIPVIYERFNGYCNNIALGKRDGVWYVFNSNGETVTTLSNISSAHIASGSRIIAASNNSEKSITWGLYGTNGALVTPFVYEYIGSFNDGLALAKKDGRYGYINENGKSMIPFHYDDAKAFFYGYAIVKQDGRAGIINQKGKTIIPIQYDEVGFFSEDLAPIKINGLWGYANKKGIVIPPQFESASYFIRGTATVTTRTHALDIDREGRVVLSENRGTAFTLEEALKRYEDEPIEYDRGEESDK